MMVPSLHPVVLTAAWTQPEMLIPFGGLVVAFGGLLLATGQGRTQGSGRQAGPGG